MFLETLSIIRGERFRIGDNPCFHCLNHEVDLVVVHTVEIPSVSLRQMLSRRRCFYRTFRIY